jgi:hypothetical protein
LDEFLPKTEKTVCTYEFYNYARMSVTEEASAAANATTDAAPGDTPTANGECPLSDPEITMRYAMPPTRF